VIGHLKADHRMQRCHLKGEIGDRLHAVLCAAGYNIRWLLRAIARKGLRAFLRLLPAQLIARLIARLVIEKVGGSLHAVAIRAAFGVSWDF
jgi:IS5 family transposase